jgi:hypothetical protein
MKLPNYDQTAISPPIEWIDIPSTWSGVGANGTFEDFPQIRITFLERSNHTRLCLANGKQGKSVKDAIVAAIGNTLTWSTGLTNYGDENATQSTAIHYDITPDTDLTETFQTLYDVLCRANGEAVNTGNGVKFDGTLSQGFGEREFMVGLIRSHQRGANEFPGVGPKVRGEYQLSKVYSKEGRIDGVEFDEAGNVVTVIECQSGIKDGACLDNDHFARIISEYPYHPDLNGTVRKLVVIAGEYLPHHVAALQAAPFEVVILQTAIENDVVVLRPYSN